MTIDVFEGARRIAKLVAALWVAGWIVGAFTELANYSASYYSQGALIAIGGLVFLWGFSWAVGWIVRGFMGIPRGHDRRSDAQ